jgi:hypothetical protein
MPDLEELRARIAAERGPSVAKARACRKADSKVRAAWALGEALGYLRWTNRHAAEYIGTDEKTIRLWLMAAQQPAWVPLALPRDGYLRYLECLLAEVPPASNRTGTDG